MPDCNALASSGERLSWLYWLCVGGVGRVKSGPTVQAGSCDSARLKDSIGKRLKPEDENGSRFVIGYPV
ncbi:hypothetical protein VZ94_08840 [Methylocucumis oryzae]|uniref:Uncharacterized protein n=1 Tax=Methylocucumis oryzae TaxID=1632867 RepID=A0A0F3IJ63_9GAMM|nr:hypothetical protein VZ94_08840 [Methylocucumis oryzae]